MEINKLYQEIENTTKSGFFYLKDCDFKKIPKNGIYVFFDINEPKVFNGKLPRIVRIGTHALTKTSKNTLPNRLKSHKGNSKNLMGNHRGSIFRLHIGDSKIRENKLSKYPLWGKGNSYKDALTKAAKFDIITEGINSSTDLKNNEFEHEEFVSSYIRNLPFIVIEENDRLKRAEIEKTFIKILTEAKRQGSIKVSKDWLGNFSSRPEIVESGLWNVDYVK